MQIPIVEVEHPSMSATSITVKRYPFVFHASICHAIVRCVSRGSGWASLISAKHKGEYKPCEYSWLEVIKSGQENHTWIILHECNYIGLYAPSGSCMLHTLATLGIGC